MTTGLAWQHPSVGRYFYRHGTDAMLGNLCHAVHEYLHRALMPHLEWHCQSDLLH